MVTRARDWIGNERIDTRFIGTVALDGFGRGRIVWGGEPIEVRGMPGVAACLLEVLDEVPPFPGAGPWRAAGSPFRLGAADSLTFVPPTSATALAMWEAADSGASPKPGPRGDPGHASGAPSSTGGGPAGAWRVLDPASTGAVASGSVLLLLHDGSAPPGSARGEPILRIFPLPARDEFTIEWNGPSAGPVRWELFALGGRLLARGEAPPEPRRGFRVPTRDSGGNPLPSGIYWIRVREGPVEAIDRIAVIH